MHEQIVRFLAAHGTLVQPDALDYLGSLDGPVERLKQGFSKGHESPLVLTLAEARRLTGDENSQANPAPARPAPAPASVGRKVAGQAPAARKGDRAGPSTQGPSAAAAQAIVEPPRPRPQPETRKPTPALQRPDGPVVTAPRQPLDPSFRDEVRRVSAEVEVLLDVTGESTCEGNLDDFTKLFRDRFNRLRRMFRDRREMVGASGIAHLKPGDNLAMIGIVNDVKTTKNGHRIIELEDDTGTATVLASNKESRLLELADTLVLDEIVGIRGKLLQERGGRQGLFIMEELVRPDVRLDHKPHRGGPGKALVVSDVHVGADTFLGDAWEALLDWVSLRVDQHRDVAQDIEYVVINGDLVEGVGIYPGQEKELHIPDVFDQYAAAADQLKRLPNDLKVIALPGNHDAVRPAEPQPAFPEPIKELFPDNVRLLGNPCTVSLTGVELLLYHGVSLFDYFEALTNCSITKPIETMVEMLRRRHLCPMYGGKTPLAPEHRDYLAIEKVPDVFVTGHVHTAQTGEYRGIRLINASTWQEQTDYQRMMGFTPDPCKAFVVDLATLDVQTLGFDFRHDTGAVSIEQADVSVRSLAAVAR